MSTETSKENIKTTKKDKPVRGVQNTVSNFPVEIGGLPVERQEENSCPGSRPLKGTFQRDGRFPDSKKKSAGSKTYMKENQHEVENCKQTGDRDQ